MSGIIHTKIIAQGPPIMTVIPPQTAESELKALLDEMAKIAMEYTYDLPQDCRLEGSLQINRGKLDFLLFPLNTIMNLVSTGEIQADEGYIVSIKSGQTIVGHGIIYRWNDSQLFRYEVHGLQEQSYYCIGKDFRHRGFGRSALALFEKIPDLAIFHQRTSHSMFRCTPLDLGNNYFKPMRKNLTLNGYGAAMHRQYGDFIVFSKQPLHPDFTWITPPIPASIVAELLELRT